jgi:hypothetical protein
MRRSAWADLRRGPPGLVPGIAAVITRTPGFRCLHREGSTAPATSAAGLTATLAKPPFGVQRKKCTPVRPCADVGQLRVRLPALVFVRTHRPYQCI